MADMPMPQGVPASAPQAQAEPGGASKLIVDVNDGLSQLLELISKGSPDLMPKAQAAHAAFQSLVDDLGAAPGQEPQGPAGPKGAMPMESGSAQSMPRL